MKGFIFDMDGLMLDTERVAALAFDYAGEKTGIGPAGYITERILGLSVDAARPVWISEFGDGYDEDGMIRYAREFKRRYYETHKVPVKPGLYELLRYLSGEGYRLAVASSTGRETVEGELSSVGVLRFFDVLVCGDMVTRSKPDPEIYLSACGALGLLPGECAALEDSRAGILSAHAAGCRVIMVPDLWQPDEEASGIADAICRDLYEVRCLIAEGRIK